MNNNNNQNFNSGPVPMMSGGNAPQSNYPQQNFNSGPVPMMSGGNAPQSNFPQQNFNNGSVPMMSGGNTPQSNFPQQNYNNGSNSMMSGGFTPHSNFPQQNIPAQDFLIQNDIYREGNFNAFLTSDYILALRNAKSAFIKQKIELLEVLTGCETKNRYSVYLRYENGVNALLFKCKEESSWCARNCITYELIKTLLFFND